MGGVFLGIDVGTSSTKIAAATADGRVLASARSHYGTAYPRPGWAEQAPEDWWGAVVSAMRAVLSHGTVAAADVGGIAVSGQGCAVTLLDAKGTVLRPAIIWMDSRSEPQSRWLREHWGDLVLQRNGKQPAPYNADPALMWLAEHEADVMERAQVSLTTTGYINYRLTGQAITNVSDASILFAYDLGEGAWSEALIEAFGLPRRLYPPIAGCSEPIGGLTGEAAAALGLPPGTPVVGGGEDTSSAGLAMGVVDDGQALLSLGTAGTVYLAQRQRTVHTRLLAFQHVVEGRMLLGGSMGSVGGALAWFREVVAPQDRPEDVVALAERSPPGAGGVIFLPYLSGELQPINDGSARGVFFGLSRATTTADLARAVLEGTAFAVAHNLAVASEIGVRANELRAVGGPTRSPLWCQIMADVTGVPLAVMPDDAGAPLGDALLAAMGAAGERGSGPARAPLTPVGKRFVPSADRHDHYQQRLGVYTELYPRLQELFGALGDSGEEVR